MTSLKVSYITSTLATAACISFKRAVPTVIFSDIPYHVILFVVSSETVLTEFFTKSHYILKNLTCKHLLCNFYSIQRQVLSSCTNGKMQSDRGLPFRDEGVLSLPCLVGQLASDLSSACHHALMIPL